MINDIGKEAFKQEGTVRIMRNFKRLLATLLAAIMMVTSSGVTALAEGITYDFSTAFIESDSNHLPYVSVDENDDYADGDGITGNHVVTDEKKDHESSNEGYISGNTGGGMGAAGRGDGISIGASLPPEENLAPFLLILWLADENSIHLEASLENPGEDTAAAITIYLDEAEAAALQQPLPQNIDLRHLDDGGAELCFSLSAASPELLELVRFAPLVPESAVEVTEADVSVTFSGDQSETAGYSFTGEPLFLVAEGSCHWTLEADSEEEEVLWTQDDPQDMHFTFSLNPAENENPLPAQSQVMDIALTLPQPFAFAEGEPVWDETLQQITLNGTPAAFLSGFHEKENVTVTGLSLSGEVLSFTVERTAAEGESLSPAELSLTVYGGAVTVKRPEPAIMTFAFAGPAQAGPLSETVQMRLDARLTSIPFAGETFAGETAGTVSLSLRAAGDIETEAWESALSGKFFWCDGYERQFRPAAYPDPVLQFRETDQDGNPLSQDWAVPTQAQLDAMNMEQLPVVTVSDTMGQSSGMWSVPAKTLPTQVTTTDIFGDKTTRYYQWRVVPAEDIPNYMLLEVTEENKDEYPTVSETGWYYMLLDTYSFDITVRWGSRGEEGGQAGISNAILECLNLAVVAGAKPQTIRLDDLSQVDQVVITPDSGEHPNHAVFSIIDIPKYNIDNTLISYTVEPYEGHDEKLDHTELPSLSEDEWYSVTYDNTGTSHGSVTDKVHDGGHIYFTLSGTTEFSAQKVWLDGGNRENRPGDSVFQLWRYREGQPYTSAAPVRDKNGKILEMAVSTDEDQMDIDFSQLSNNDGGESDPLPKYDSEGYRYIYVVREYLEGENAGNYEQVFGDVKKDDATGTVTYTDQVPPTETELPEETIRTTASRGNDNTFVYDGGTLSNRRKGTTNATAVKSWEAAAFQAQLNDVRVEFTLQVRPKGESTDDPENGWETVLDSDGKPIQIEMENFTAEDLVERSETRSASKYGPFGREMEYRWVESGVYQKGTDGTYGENLLKNGVFTLQQGGREILYRSESTVCQEEDGSWVTRLENSIANTITYHVEKRWHQSLNPQEITLQLYVMGADGTVGKPLCEFTMDGTADGTPTTVTIDGFGSFTVQEGENGAPEDGSDIGHIWAADLRDLPQYDSSGRLYEYVLLEKVDEDSGRIPQSQTTKDEDGNYTTVLTNGPGEGNQILVRKSWIDDGDSLHRESVTIGVYHRTQTDPETQKPLRISEVTLESGIWLKEVGIGSYTPDEVFLVEEKIGGKELDYAARLENSQSSHYAEGTNHIYEVTYSEKEELAGASCYTVTNRRLGHINIVATKHWNDGGNNGQRIEDALEAIPQTERPRLVLRLQFANQLAQYDIRRAAEGYDEISLGGDYIPVRDNGGDPDAENGGDFSTILRDLEYGANDTEYYFSGLPKYDTEGRVAHYTIEEIWVDSSGQEVSLTKLAEKSAHTQAWQNLLDVWKEYTTSIKQTDYSVEEHHDRDTQSMSVTNSRVGYKEIRWHKQWQDAYAYEQGVRPDLYLDLYRYTSNPDTAQKLTLYRSNYRWRPVASEEEDPDGLYDEKWHWHAVFSGLDKYDDDGYEYTYYAIEHTSVNASDFDYPPAQYKKTADGATGTELLGTVDAPLDNSAVESGWMIELTAECACNQQDIGKYLLREEGTFLNALSGEALIQGDKIWTGLPTGYDRENDLPGVTFTVQQKLRGVVTNEKIATLTITSEDWEKLQASGRYKFTIQYQGSNVVHITGEGDQQQIAFHPEGDPQNWKPLPKYDETNGNLYEYTLSESVQFIGEGAPADEVVFVKDGSGFSFNNQYISQQNLTPFTVKKHLYLPKDENGAYVFPGVTFQLSRTYIKNDGITVSAPEILGTVSWKSQDVKKAWESMTDEDEQKQNGYVTGTISFGDQEIYAPNGSRYTYTVTEVKDNLAGFDTWAAAGELSAANVMTDANKHDPTAEGSPTEPQVTGITLQALPEGQQAPIYATFANQRTEIQQTLTAIQGTKIWKDFGNHFGLRAEDFTSQSSDKGGSAITLTLSRYAKTQPGQNNAIDLEPVTAAFQGDWYEDGVKDPTTDNKTLYSTWYYSFVSQADDQVLEKYAPNGMPWIYVVEETLTGDLTNYDVEKGRVELSAQNAVPEDGTLTLTLPELVNSLERTVTYSKTWVDKSGKPITEDVLGYPVEVTFRLDVAEYIRTQTGTDEGGKPVYSYDIVGGNNGWQTASNYFDPKNGNIGQEAYNAIFGGSTPPFSQVLEGHLGDAAVWGVEFDGPTKLPVAIRKNSGQHTGEIVLLTYRVVETQINRIGEDGTKTPVVSFGVEPSDDGKKYTYTYPAGSFFEPVYYPDGLSDGPKEYNHSYTRSLCNTLDEAALTVTKQWVGDHQNAYNTRPATTRTGGYTWQTSLLIQRSVSPDQSDSWEHIYTRNGQPAPLIVTLYGDNSQHRVDLSISGLPVKDGEENPYTYRVRELSADLNWVDTTDPEVSAAIQDITEKGDQSSFVLGADAHYSTAYTVTYPQNNPAAAVNTLDSTKLYASKEWIRDENLTTGVTFQLQYQVSATQWRNLSAPAGTVALNGTADTPAANDPSYELDPETASPYRWMAVWEDLPLRIPGSWLTDENSVTNYRIVETVAGGQGGNYIQTSAAEDYSNGGETYTIWRFVNTQKTTYQVQKVWALDAGVNPPNATVTLYRTTDESKIGTGQGELVSVSGNPHTFSGRTPAIKSFANLPKYSENHQLYYYYALETRIGTTDVDVPDGEGYATIGTQANRYDAYHSWAADHTKTTVLNIGYKDLPITKVWKDNGDAYGTRPNDLALTLYHTPAGGREEAVTAVQPEWTDHGDSTWTLTYTGLPMADPQGNVYTYRVEEEPISEISGKGSYVPTGPVSENGGFTLTNTLNGETALTVTKNWVDGDNADKTRPQSITVTLYQNGQPMPGKTVEIKAPNALQQLFGADGNQWSYTFTNLPKYDEDGMEYTYTVTEEPVNGYSSAQNGATFTNTLLTSVQVEKIWPGVAEADKKPVTVKLYHTTADNPTENDWTEVPVSEGGGEKIITAPDWTITYSSLVRFAPDGSRYKFKVAETAIDGKPVTDYDYIIQYGGNDTSTAGLIELLVANINPGSLTGTKTWKDNGNAYITRPSKLELTLERTTVWNNPTEDDWKEVPAGEYTLTWSNTDTDQWTYIIEGFPSADGTGNLYLYRVREEAIDPLPGGDHYQETSGSSGDYDFTNTLRGTLDIPVTKVWQDNDDAFGLRPKQITLELYANGGTDPVETAQLNAPSLLDLLLGDRQNIWRYTFEDLPKYDDSGAYITYEVREVLTAEDGEVYQVTVYPESADASDLPAEGFTLTNTGEGRLLVTKTVTGSRGDRRKDFTFTPVFVNGADEELTQAFPYEKNLQDGTVQTGEIVSGESFLLKDGERMKIDGLPGTTRYTVTESDNSGYRVSSSGADGEILPGVERTASFNNYRGGSGGGGGSTPDPKPQEEPTPDDSLPQTGQNWMLPFLLAAAGGALVATGTWMSRRKGRKHDDP